MNKMYVGATVFMCVLILMYLWMKLMNHNIQSMTVYGNTVLLLLFAVGNAVIYCRDKATDKLKVAAAIEMGLNICFLGCRQMQSLLPMCWSHVSHCSFLITIKKD